MVQPFSVSFAPGVEKIIVLTLEQAGSPVVVLDQPLLQRLEATLRTLPQDARGLVLASAAERAFVAGADLKAIADLDDAALHAYLASASRVYAMISELPYPTCAAIHSHALGGGMELAMHCDGLAGAPTPVRDGQPKPYQVGLPEAGLGICPGWGGTALLPARMTKDPAEAIRRTCAGKALTSDEAIAMGVFDVVAPDARSVVASAAAWVDAQARAGGIGRTHRDGAPSRHAGRGALAAEVVRAIDRVKPEVAGSAPGLAVLAALNACVASGGGAAGFAACLQVEQRELVKLRHTPRAREAIAKFLKR